MVPGVRVLGVPMDYGADRRGVDMGPSAIRYAGLLDRLKMTEVKPRDVGDIVVPRPEVRDPETAVPDRGRAKYLHEIRSVTETVAHRVETTIDDGLRPLVLGGDHAVAIGTVRGVASRHDVGVLWFDAHGDCNTPETSPSGNVHGMALAALLGLGAFEDDGWARAPGLRPGRVALIGTRELDPEERQAIRSSGIHVFTMEAIDRRGIAEVVATALDRVSEGTEGVHVSLDLDWIDPTDAPGVGTPVRGGVTYREAHTALELVAERTATGSFLSLELLEVNPILDTHNATAELACELAATAFGRRIL